MPLRDENSAYTIAPIPGEPLRVSPSAGSFELEGFDTGARMHRIGVVRGGSVTVRCADGAIAEIGEGKHKVFVSRPGSNALHLIDCVCGQCRQLRDCGLPKEGES
jgi:hypothetical protein